MMHWITIDFSSGVIIEYHNRGLSLERQWFSTASEVLRTQSKLPSMIIAIIALLWRLPLYSPLVIIGVKELYSKTLIDDNSVNYPSTLLLIRHNNTYYWCSSGVRMSSILRTILTSCVARRICCFLLWRDSITCCTFMSAQWKNN